MRRALVTKKLLVASIGVASVTYAACSKDPPPPQVGNLMPPMAADASIPRHLVGNLMPVGLEPAPSASAPPPVVGNLMPPQVVLDGGAPKKP